MISIEDKVRNKIYGMGRGWAFSQIDFARLGSRSAIDLALHRLMRKGTIRRVLRGLYDYPRTSTLLGQTLSPDVNQVAQALARKFGWRIQPSGQTALNVLGLSTQVPGRYVYLSDGPGRSYQVGKQELRFEQTVLREVGFKQTESALLVNALKALGADRVDANVEAQLREWLKPNLRKPVLNDTSTVRGWVREILRRICQEGENG
jgi:hypothetical protein